MRGQHLWILGLALTACDVSGHYAGDDGVSSGTSVSGPQVEAGQITAGEWDDAANLQWFDRMLDTSFSALRDEAALPLDGRIIATITDSLGQPIPAAEVELLGTTHRLTAGTDGRVLLLTSFDGAAMLRVTAPDGSAVETEPRATIVIPDAVAAPPNALDLAFVVDATGSMSDEISYLQAEIRSIAAKVEEAHPGISIQFALIVYRDEGDAYVTRVFNFTTLSAFHANLLAQGAGGGGDYPEAAERAMQDATSELSWRTGNVARVLFHVADAPPHAPQYSAFLRTALTAREKGIRIFPVAASGVAKEAEYLMRSSALATLGRYLFLTDDSGIGNPHEEPTVPCYRVERLATLLARTIDSELSGAYIPPAPEDVIRVVGTFDGDTCVSAQ